MPLIDAVEIDVEAPIPIVVLRLLQWPADADARIVHQDMNLAVKPHRLLGGRGHCRPVGNVEAGSDGRVWPRALNAATASSRWSCADVSDDDFHAGAGEGFGDAEPDAAGAAGDERDFAGKIFHAGQPHNSLLARRAPSASVSNLAHITVGWTRWMKSTWAKPQSVPAMTFSRPTILA